MQTRTKKRKAVPDLNLVYNPIPPVDCSSVNDYLAENPLVYQPSVVNPVLRCFLPLPVVNNSIYQLPTVEKTLVDLPHHIIIDILLRLPALCVFRCQRASKLIEILSTTPFFVRKHLARQSTSIIALQSFSKSSDQELKFCFIDEQTKKVTQATLKLDFCYAQRDSPVVLYDSYDGFLLFKNKDSFSSGSIFIIWNPTTKEQVTITMKDCLHFTVCGFYFNPHNKEYEMLLLHQDFRGGNRGKYAFDILSFGSKSSQRKIKLQRNIGRHSYRPSPERPPRIINGTLYWMVDDISIEREFTCSNSILTFEIETHKLSTIQHGGASCGNARNQHRYMQLIEMQGRLGLCLTKDAFMQNTKLVLWALIDPATNRWANTHIVTLPKYSKPDFFASWPNRLNEEVVKMKDGKLLVRQMNRLLLWDLDLDMKSPKIVQTKGFKGDSFRPVIHTHSLVSLNTQKIIPLT